MGENNGNGDNKEVTYTLSEDGSLVAKEGESEVRYVKESDLLAVKGSKEAAEQRVKDLESKSSSGDSAKAELESTRQKQLQAEARVSSLEEQIAAGSATAAERDKLKADLETAKNSSEELSKEFLELQRTLIVGTYGVPRATVDSKDKEALKLYAEALADVTGKKMGNYAAGGGGAGADLSGKSPMELARIAYDSGNKK